MFVYAIGEALCRFPGNLPDMNLDLVSLDTQCFLTGRKGALALAFNYRENALYFSENVTRTISKVKLSRDETPVILIGGTGTVEGLVVDWLASNIYWTDRSSGVVMAAKADGRFQRVIHADMVEQPRGIDIHGTQR